MKRDDFNKEDLIQYRINRAAEAIAEAKLLADNQKWNTSIARLYYACFYAVSALLVKHDLKHGTHEGTKTQFNKCFVKTEIVNKDWSRFYSRLYSKRGEADYEDFVSFEKKDVDALIPKTEEFVQLVKNML